MTNIIIGPNASFPRVFSIIHRLKNNLPFRDFQLCMALFHGYFPIQLVVQSYVPSKKDRYFILVKRWKEHARKRIFSVGFASPEACSIVSSMKHTSPVVRLDFPIHLPLSSTTVPFFAYLPLRLHIVCRRHRVRQSRISTHGTFALAYAIRAPFSSLFSE